MRESCVVWSMDNHCITLLIGFNLEGTFNNNVSDVCYGFYFSPWMLESPPRPSCGVV